MILRQPRLLEIATRLVGSAFKLISTRNIYWPIVVPSKAVMKIIVIVQLFICSLSAGEMGLSR